jgi:ribosomal subunit interface protein
MIYNIAGKGITVTDEVRDYAERRFEHLERILGRQKIEPLLQCDMELHTGEASAPYTVRATVDVAGDVLHAESPGTTLHEAIDAAARVLVNEAEKIKGRRLNIRRYASKAKDFLRGLGN